MALVESTAIELTKKRLFSPAQKEKIKRRSLLQAGLVENDSNTEDKNLRTLLRIRPGENSNGLLEIESDKSVIFRPQGKNRADQYTFSKVLDEKTDQAEVFNETCKNLLEAILADRNSCLFTYGASGSGKTYTIMGGSGNKAGLLPRSLESIFSSLKGKMYQKQDIRPTGSAYICRVSISDERKWAKIKDELMNQDLDEHFSGDWANKRRNSLLNVSLQDIQGTRLQAFFSGPFVEIGTKEEPIDGAPLSGLVHDTDYILFGSFIEIYNEKIYDLLVPPKKRSREELRIRQDAKGPFVGGVREIQINLAEEAYRLLEAGKQNQIVAQTRLNQESSRSHCLFQLKVVRRITRDRWSVASLAFCDLAGAERSKRVGNDRTRLAESKTINKSLLQLGVVIEDLRRNQNKPGTVAVSFRNSKLTRLMQAYLTGNSKTTIVVAVSQDPSLTEETQNSLKFAATAQTIQTIGTDGQGRALMESTRANITRLNDHTMFKDGTNSQSVCFKTMSATMMEAHSSTFKQPTSSISQSSSQSSLPTQGVSNNWDENYAKWKKVDLIEDLVYFRDRDRENQNIMLQMKEAWKEDEQYKEYYRQQVTQLQKDYTKQEKELRNEQEIQVAELLAKYRAKVQELKELKQSNVTNEELAELRNTEKEYLRLQKTYQTIVKENLVINEELEAFKVRESEENSKFQKAKERENQLQNQILDLQEELKMARVGKINDVSLDISIIEPPMRSLSPLKSLQQMNSTHVNGNEPKMNSTQMHTTLDLLEASGMGNQLKTPDLSLVQPNTNNGADTVDLYRQIQSLQVDLRSQKELTECLQNKLNDFQDLEQRNVELEQQLCDQLVELDKLSKASSSIKSNSSKQNTQSEEAAKREADLEYRVNELEIENEMLKKQCDRSLLRKKNEALRQSNVELLERIAELESKPTNLRQRSPEPVPVGRQLRNRVI